MSYLVVIELGEKSVGAYVPDLPGCAAIGDTEEEALRLLREAMARHIGVLEKRGLPVPRPRSHAELVSA